MTTTLFDKEYRVVEWLISSRDRYFFDMNGGYQGLPKATGEIVQIDRVIVNNSIMSIKRDTILSFCFKFNLNPQFYSSVQQANSSSVIPSFHPVTNQYTSGTINTQQYVLTRDEYLVLPVTITIPAGNYTTLEFAAVIQSLMNAQYQKPINLQHSHGENVVVATNGTYNYQFRLRTIVGLQNNKLQFNFQLWNQSNSALESARPEFRATDSIALLVNNLTNAYTTYLYSNLSNHEIYLSGDKWLLDKMGLECSYQKNNKLKPIMPGDYRATLFEPTYKAPVITTTAIAGFNDIVGYNSLTYVSQEELVCASPRLCDMKLGSGLFVCMSGFGTNVPNLHDSRGISRDAVHYVNLRMYDFGSIIEECPAKWLYIGDKCLDNNFEIYFMDEDGDRVDPRDLNFTISLKIYSKHVKLQL